MLCIVVHIRRVGRLSHSCHGRFPSRSPTNPFTNVAVRKTHSFVYITVGYGTFELGKSAITATSGNVLIK